MSDFELISVESAGNTRLHEHLPNGDNSNCREVRAWQAYAVDDEDDLNAANWTPLWIDTAGATHFHSQT